jgi:hypothetical protein
VSALFHDRVVAGFMAGRPGGQASNRSGRHGATPEGQLLRQIQDALRAEPELLWRNSAGVTEHHGRRVTYGLGLGNSDLRASSGHTAVGCTRLACLPAENTQRIV